MTPPTLPFIISLINTTGEPAGGQYTLHASDLAAALANAAATLQAPHLRKEGVVAALVRGPGVEAHEAYDVALSAVRVAAPSAS